MIGSCGVGRFGSANGRGSSLVPWWAVVGTRIGTHRWGIGPRLGEAADCEECRWVWFRLGALSTFRKIIRMGDENGRQKPFVALCSCSGLVHPQSLGAAVFRRKHVHVVQFFVSADYSAGSHFSGRIQPVASRLHRGRDAPAGSSDSRSIEKQSVAAFQKLHAALNVPIACLRINAPFRFC